MRLITWNVARRLEKLPGLDHVLVSRGIAVEACAYLHAWRTDGLSDHPALKAVLRPPPRASGARR